MAEKAEQEDDKMAAQLAGLAQPGESSKNDKIVH